MAVPVVLTGKLWTAIWAGEQSRGWDGTGHYASAQLYSSLIFPDSFGWTSAYFGGMPLPNFYPPVFYWCVALLHHTHLFSFTAAFKLVLTLPVLLMPAAVWWLCWHLSNKSRLVATAASLASVVLLIDVRFMGSLLAGLDYFSTFQIGLYTQPLGFVLMIAWYVIYSGVNEKHVGRMPALPAGRVALASVLLALTVLSNFFNAITAVLFIVATIGSDLFHLRRSADAEHTREKRNALLLHLLSPIIALLLTLFWIVPMITEYEYFVTRPYVVETQSLISPGLAIWYLIALVGSVLWWRGSAEYQTGESEHGDARKKRRGTSSPTKLGGNNLAAPYLSACFILAMAVIFAAIFAPSWFPLQTPRFLATLTFLLTVPVGFALAAAFRGFANLLREISPKNPSISLKRARYTVGTSAIIVLVIVMSAPDLSWAYAFYPKGQRTNIDDVLDFARAHPDGRYLVEVINPKIGPAWTEASFDARAINSYLGAQGNETIGGVFHEASPNALFTLPVVNAFSNYPDSFGVSSVLADDLDFAAQPLSEQIKRAQFLGVKYLVIRTPAMKERVSKEIASAVKHEIGWWAVFELPGPPAPKVQALPYKPALVLSSFTVKARRRNEMGFIRLAEEQFSDNWFDVLLARSPESKIDHLQDLDKFGALVIDGYDYSDETAAFERLRKFAQDRSLICLSSDNALFKRIQKARADFPLLEIIERQREEPGETIEALKPSYRYGSSSIRQQWKAIREILDHHKISTGVDPTEVSGEIDQNNIKLVSNSAHNSNSIPVLITNTFHPNWQRGDGSSIYAATPFYMLTFVDQSSTISYGRRWFDRAGLWASAATLLLLFVFTTWHRRRARTAY